MKAFCRSCFRTIWSKDIVLRESEAEDVEGEGWRPCVRVRRMDGLGKEGKEVEDLDMVFVEEEEEDVGSG